MQLGPGHYEENFCEVNLNLDNWSERDVVKTKKRYFISRALAVLFSVEWNHLCNFGRRHHEEQFCKIYFEFGPVIQEETLFKDISYLELWRPLCSAE